MRTEIEKEIWKKATQAVFNRLPTYIFGAYEDHAVTIEEFRQLITANVVEFKVPGHYPTQDLDSVISTIADSGDLHVSVHGVVLKKKDTPADDNE